MKRLNQIFQLLSATILLSIFSILHNKTSSAEPHKLCKLYKHPLAPVNSVTLPEYRHYGFWESMRIAWREQRARKGLWTE